MQPTVDELAEQTGRRIALTTEDRQLDRRLGGPGGAPLPVNETRRSTRSTVDRALKPGASVDRIDPSVRVGPYRLTADRAATSCAASPDGLESCAESRTSESGDAADGADRDQAERAADRRGDRMRWASAMVTRCLRRRSATGSASRRPSEAATRSCPACSTLPARRGLTRRTQPAAVYAGPDRLDWQRVPVRTQPTAGGGRAAWTTARREQLDAVRRAGRAAVPHGPGRRRAADVRPVRRRHHADRADRARRARGHGRRRVLAASRLVRPIRGAHRGRAAHGRRRPHRPGRRRRDGRARPAGRGVQRHVGAAGARPRRSARRWSATSRTSCARRWATSAAGWRRPRTASPPSIRS